MAQKTKDWTVLSMLNWGTEFLEEKGIKNPRLSIEWLLSHTLKVKRLDLYLAFDRPISASELEILRPLIKRRAQHEPLQYITGETDFLRTRIQVNEHVLIPRPETEQLVELVLEKYNQPELNVIDIGTGSGCIPIALKMERPEWNVSGIDISEDALSVAKKNASLNNVDVAFGCEDLFLLAEQQSNEQYDIIISNPPYVLQAEKEILDKEVVDFEPHLALFCESTTHMYSALQKFARKTLTDKGILFLEIHQNQSKEIENVFNNSEWSITIKTDYDGHDRFAVCTPK